MLLKDLVYNFKNIKSIKVFSINGVDYNISDIPKKLLDKDVKGFHYIGYHFIKVDLK